MGYGIFESVDAHTTSPRRFPFDTLDGARGKLHDRTEGYRVWSWGARQLKNYTDTGRPVWGARLSVVDMQVREQETGRAVLTVRFRACCVQELDENGVIIRKTNQFCTHHQRR